MAVVSVSLWCGSVSKLTPLAKPPSISSPKPPLSNSCPRYHTPLVIEASEKLIACVGQSVGRASFLALLSASLCFSPHPSLAFKGGGPYGAEVTRGQDLSGKDFSGRTLIKQDFKTSILRQANFKGADLSDADLRGADFSLANVTKANLSNANLEGALATGNTSFKGSNITGADFTDVPLREDQLEYLCKVADGVNPTTGNATRETLFCK